jgi:hypothetical protein
MPLKAKAGPHREGSDLGEIEEDAGGKLQEISAVSAGHSVHLLPGDWRAISKRSNFWPGSHGTFVAPKPYVSVVIGGDE